ncbi:MAG: DUF4879 domain-containing protein [Bacillales bacterium]|nr:DUF4879 domain-containing protein [Bacillales bacterium]
MVNRWVKEYKEGKYDEMIPGVESTPLETKKLAQENEQFIDSTDEENEKLKKQKDVKNLEANGDVGIMGSAPPLTYLEVYAAISSNYPTYEYFSQDQRYSTEDHGGTEMYIVTAELGYGYQQSAEMNELTLSEVQSQYIDLNGDSIIDGWYTWWDASGNENGAFTYQNTSATYPWNTMTDFMNVK